MQTRHLTRMHLRWAAAILAIGCLATVALTAVAMRDPGTAVKRSAPGASTIRADMPTDLTGLMRFREETRSFQPSTHRACPRSLR